MTVVSAVSRVYLGSTEPDFTTVRGFREALSKAGAIPALFDAFNSVLEAPKNWLCAHVQTLFDEDDWQTVQERLEVRLIEHTQGEPVLCCSGARPQKERAMLEHQSDRLTEELSWIDAWLRRTP